MPDFVCGAGEQASAIRRARSGRLSFGGFRSALAAAPRSPEGIPARRIDKGTASGGVGQVSFPSECGRGVQPSAEGREPGLRREGTVVGADALDKAQKPGELDGKGT